MSTWTSNWHKYNFDGTIKDFLNDVDNWGNQNDWGGTWIINKTVHEPDKEEDSEVIKAHKEYVAELRQKLSKLAVEIAQRNSSASEILRQLEDAILFPVSGWIAEICTKCVEESQKTATAEVQYAIDEATVDIKKRIEETLELANKKHCAVLNELHSVKEDLAAGSLDRQQEVLERVRQLDRNLSAGKIRTFEESDESLLKLVHWERLQKLENAAARLRQLVDGEYVTTDVLRKELGELDRTA